MPSQHTAGMQEGDIRRLTEGRPSAFVLSKTVRIGNNTLR